MKALVIADNENVIKKIDNTLKTLGFDSIVYRWLLKALDNIDEIAPHVIIISTEDYPRHWKTLSQFSGSNSTNEFEQEFHFPKVILYVGDNFTEEENKKAQALNVLGIFKNNTDDKEAFNGEDGFIELGKLLSELSLKLSKSNDNKIIDYKEDSIAKIEDTNIEVESEQKKENTEESNEDLPTLPCSFIFTNPVTLALVSGTARNFNGETLDFYPDILNFTKNIIPGTIVKSATLKTSESIESIDSIKSVVAIITSNDGEKLSFKIVESK